MQTLNGLKVLELARILAGPWAGQTLADLGADVVKVEAEAGDDTRQWGPPYVGADEGAPESAAYFHSCNRGKRSITANFADEKDRVRVLELAAKADVIIENFKVGGLKRFGLDYESIHASNPRVIYASITGFGQDGPYAPRAGYDFLIQGMGGAMSVTGQPDGPPTKTGFAIADLFSGLYATIGILAALNRREKTGSGAHVDCALLDTQVAVLANQAMNYLVSGREPVRLGNAHPNVVPYDVFPVSDGHCIIAVGNDSQFARLCDVLGIAELAVDPRFARNDNRVENRDVLTVLLGERSRLMTQAQLLQIIVDAGIPGGPINTISSVFENPQIVHRGMRIDRETSGRSVPGVRTPLMIDGQPTAHAEGAPALGAHNGQTVDW
ncbi:MAG: CoA transferase [Rhizobiaceae bacterium]|nr:CoA transferase [Rhizobiaceae bacterium]